MNGIELVDLLCEFGIGVISERAVIYEVDKDELNFDFHNQLTLMKKELKFL
ncbi:MAG: hypothetical protein HC854_04195 [Flavobacterium sp.]|nr:hypothetical protein [Flavobacterium sp.]